MMIQAIRLTRKKAALAVIAAGVLIAALILLLGRGGEPSAIAHWERRTGRLSSGVRLGGSRRTSHYPTISASAAAQGRLRCL